MKADWKTALKGLLLTGFALVGWRAFQSINAIRLNQATAEGTYTDTYYVTANVHLIAGILLAIALPVLLHIFVLRHADRPWIRGSSYGCLFLCLAGLLVWSFQHILLGASGPWQYTDYSNLAFRFALLNFAAMATVAVACIASILLSLIAWRHQRR